MSVPLDPKPCSSRTISWAARRALPRPASSIRCCGRRTRGAAAPLPRSSPRLRRACLRAPDFIRRQRYFPTAPSGGAIDSRPSSKPFCSSGTRSPAQALRGTSIRLSANCQPDNNHQQQYDNRLALRHRELQDGGRRQPPNEVGGWRTSYYSHPRRCAARMAAPFC